MAGAQWWVIIGIGANPNTPVFSYFQGTSAQAHAAANKVVQIAGQTNLSGPYATKADAQKAVSSGQVQPQNPSAGPQPNLFGQPAPSVPNPLSGLASIGDFFSRLTNANTWLRLGEVVLGVLLIAVGVAKMTNAVPAATKIARAVA